MLSLLAPQFCSLGSLICIKTRLPISKLKIATNHFNRLFEISEGGFGSIYKGRINPYELDAQHHPIFVAVEKLKEDGLHLQGHKQRLTEVQFLGVVEHPNLVKLIGYRAPDDKKGIQRLLVYEYIPNKSLAGHPFRKDTRLFPWENRLLIMLGAAQGRANLNELLEVQVSLFGTLLHSYAFTSFCIPNIHRC